MSKSFSTPALVLRRWPAGEHALVVRLLTPSQGILPVYVMGAQKPASSLHFLGNPFTLIEVEVVPTRGMDRATQALCRATFPTLVTDLDRLQGAALVAEVAEQTSTEGLANPALFIVTLETLQFLESEPLDQREVALLRFLWLVLEFQGAAPVLDRCIRTGSLEAGAFVVPLALEGGFAAEGAAASFPQAARLPVELLHLLQVLSDALHASDALPELPEATPELRRLGASVLLHFLQGHLGHPLKTAEPYLTHHLLLAGGTPLE